MEYSYFIEEKANTWTGQNDIYLIGFKSDNHVFSDNIENLFLDPKLDLKNELIKNGMLDEKNNKIFRC